MHEDEHRGCYIVTDRPELVEASKQVSMRYSVALEALTQQFAQSSLSHLVRDLTQKDGGVELLVPTGVVAELCELGGTGARAQAGGFRLSWSTEDYTYGNETVKIDVVAGFSKKSDLPGDYKTMPVVLTGTSDAQHVRNYLGRKYQLTGKREGARFAVLSPDRQFLPMFVSFGVKRLGREPLWWQHSWARI